MLTIVNLNIVKLIDLIFKHIIWADIFWLNIFCFFLSPILIMLIQLLIIEWRIMNLLLKINLSIISSLYINNCRRTQHQFLLQLLCFIKLNMLPLNLEITTICLKTFIICSQNQIFNFLLTFKSTWEWARKLWYLWMDLGTLRRYNNASWILVDVTCILLLALITLRRI